MTEKIIFWVKIHSEEKKTPNMLIHSYNKWEFTMLWNEGARFFALLKTVRTFVF